MVLRPINYVGKTLEVILERHQLLYDSVPFLFNTHQIQYQTPQMTLGVI